MLIRWWNVTLTLFTMRRLQPLLALALLTANLCYAQTAAPRDREKGEERALERNALFFELKALDAEASELRKPLARSRVKVEIADTAWELDREWAKKLLREAYELTFPDDGEREALRRQAVGEGVKPPTDLDWARIQMRDRVFAVARRAASFADELSQLGAKELGRGEEERRNWNLASQALSAGNAEVASKYVSLAIKADPTRGAAFVIIPNIARFDRATADRLIIEFIEQLRVTPLSMSNGSAVRAHSALQNVMGSGQLGKDGKPVPPPGPAVWKAYVSYVVESMTALGQSEPNGLQVLRSFLLTAWAPLQLYAPELTARFVALEQLSRRAGEAGGLPKPDSNEAEARKARAEDQLQQALKSGRPDDEVISRAGGRKDFAAARKLIDLLPEGEKKSGFVEWVNVEEASSLLAGGDQAGAEKLAQELNKPESILRVYAALMGRCAQRKDAQCVTELANRAAGRLRRLADTSSAAAALAGLAEAAAPLNEGLAFDMLDEAVAAANSNSLAEAEFGRLPIETGAFNALAARNEPRARQSAQTLKERTARIAALAAVYKLKAKALVKPAAIAVNRDRSVNREP